MKHRKFDNNLAVYKLTRDIDCDPTTCYRCGGDTKVYASESRPRGDGYNVRVRYRKCLECDYRQQTLELICATEKRWSYEDATRPKDV